MTYSAAVFGDIPPTLLFWRIPRGAMEDQRMQHQNSIIDNILKLSISCLKNLPRISGAIHDLVNDTAYRFMSIGLLVIS